MRRLAALVLASALVLSCSGDDAASHGAAPRPDVTEAAPADGDLTELAERIVQLHPDPFHHLDRAEFEARVIADADDPDRLLVDAMRLANLGVGEGHGGVYPWAQPGLEAWPLHLYEFDDGFRVVAGEGAPLGARLVAIGGTAIAEVADAVRPLVPHDNEWTVRSRLPAFLVVPAVLRGLGLDAAELTWELPSGETATEPAPPTVPADAFADLLGLFQAQVPPTLPYDRDRIVWSEPRGEVLYVRWNQVQRTDRETSLSAVATSLVEAVESGAARRVVIDARHNPGGEIGAATSLALAVTEIEQAHPGTVRFLVGRGTFSAASHVIGRLAAETGVVLVGEPTGGSTRSYADPSRVELPRSGIVAFVDTGLYESGDATWAALEPDVAVETTWADVEAGRDPVYEVAVER